VSSRNGCGHLDSEGLRILSARRQQFVGVASCCDESTSERTVSDRYPHERRRQKGSMRARLGSMISLDCLRGASIATSCYTRPGMGQSTRRVGSAVVRPRRARLIEVVMLSVRESLVVVGCVFVGFVTSAGPGLVARAAEPPRWVEGALTPSDGSVVPGGGVAQRPIAPLKKLEAQRHVTTAAGPASDKASPELEAVLAQNRELTERNRALASENQALTQSHLFVPPAKVCEPPPSADPRAQIRYWAQLLRDSDTGSTRPSKCCCGPSASSTHAIPGASSDRRHWRQRNRRRRRRRHGRWCMGRA
jgi:hypothetical protein